MSCRHRKCCFYPYRYLCIQLLEHSLLKCWTYREPSVQLHSFSCCDRRLPAGLLCAHLSRAFRGFNGYSFTSVHQVIEKTDPVETLIKSCCIVGLTFDPKNRLYLYVIWIVSGFCDLDFNVLWSEVGNKKKTYST